MKIYMTYAPESRDVVAWQARAMTLGARIKELDIRVPHGTHHPCLDNLANYDAVVAIITDYNAMKTRSWDENGFLRAEHDLSEAKRLELPVYVCGDSTAPVAVINGRQGKEEIVCRAIAKLVNAICGLEELGK